MLTEDQKKRHLPHMQGIADADVAQLTQKDAEYGASWKSRGGVGAFMMLARKWDRLENMVKASRDYEGNPVKPTLDAPMTTQTAETIHASAYDIFAHVMGSELERGDSESLRDSLGDLRRYLLLVEAEVDAAQGKEPVSAGELPTFQELMGQAPDAEWMVKWLNANGRFTIRTDLGGDAVWTPNGSLDIKYR